MFWKHPITKKNRFLPVVHATNGIPSYFDHDLSKTSTAVNIRVHGRTAAKAGPMTSSGCVYCVLVKQEITEIGTFSIP